MRARLIFASILGVASAVVAIQLVTRNGDTPSALAQADQLLSSSFQPKVLLPREEKLTGGKVYTAVAPDGRTLAIELDAGPVEKELEYFFAEVTASRALSRAEVLRSLGSRVGQVSQVAPAFNDLSDVWSALTYPNQQTAKAKALLHYAENPAELESYVWRDRTTMAARAWAVETMASYRGRLLGYGVGGAAGGFGGTLAARVESPVSRAGG